MKIRGGFVSNSSSTSFMIVGARYDTDEFFEALKESVLRGLCEEQKYDIENENNNTCQDATRCEMQEYLQDCDIYEILESISRIYLLDYVYDYDREGVYLGITYRNMRIDETKCSFEERIKNKLEEIVYIDKVFVEVFD